MRIGKLHTLLRALALNRLVVSAPFVRIIPTDYCNLDCSYCWQHGADRHQMSAALFSRCLANARQLNVGLVSFLGGEPMLWRHLLEAIAQCNAFGIPTDMTTNGSLLSAEWLRRLGDAGLDLLNISIDGLAASGSSRKCSLGDPVLLAAAKAEQARSGLQVRLNAVICRHNWESIAALLRFSHEAGLPISLGFAMPRGAKDSDFDADLHFAPADLPDVSRVIADIAAARKAGVQIIDPPAYFENFPRYLRRESFWVCNYATRRGWINVDPYGEVRDCTKKLGRTGVAFESLSRAALKDVRGRLAAGVRTCNKACYSNCAFDSAFYVRHKFRFLSSGVL